MTPRSGVTLIEVLVSIFIMSIGLLALLALYPLGALNMAQAIKDDRSGHIAANARAMAQIGINGDDYLHIRYNSNYYSSNLADPINAYTNADNNFKVWPSRANVIGQGYPVYVDPIGCQAYSGSLLNGTPLGTDPNNGNGLIPRRGPKFLGDNTAAVNIKMALQWFSFLDDITFDDNGISDVSGGNVQREGRYSWAFMCRELSATQVTPPSPVELSVIVYSGRSLQLTQQLTGGTMQPSGENTYMGYFASTNVISVIYNPANKPTIRRGGWVLDAAMWPDAHGYFYRVVNVTDPSPNPPPNLPAGMLAIDLETQTPLRGTYSPTQAVTNPVVFMDNVVEVFDVGT